MNRNVRVWVGAVTVVVFGVIGATLYTEGNTLLGSVLLAMTALRAVVLIKQIWGQDATQDQ